MKKFVVIIAVVISALMMFALCACGGNKESAPFVGKWKGEYSKLVGTDDAFAIEEDFSLVLKSDGSGTSSRDGYDYRASWKLEDGRLKVSEKFLGLSIEYEGYILDGKLHLYNGDPADDLTYEYVYVKE